MHTTHPTQLIASNLSLLCACSSEADDMLAICRAVAEGVLNMAAGQATVRAAWQRAACMRASTSTARCLALVLSGMVATCVDV
jgi:hypothetical protein